MAINFLNTVAVDDSVLFVDTINNRVGIGTASLVTKLEVSTGLGNGSDGVFIKDPFAGTSRTANSKNPMLSLGTSTENGSAATIFMGANATPTDQDSKIEFNRTGGYLSIWYKGQGTYREHVRYGSPASSTPKSAFFGNVGIRTTSPGVALDVNGEIAIRGGEDADDARMYFRASDNSNRFTIETDLDGTTSNDLLGFRSVDTDNILVLKGNGNVGIGTTSPDAKLHVYSTGNGEAIIERASGAKILLQAQSAAGVIGTSSNHDLDIKTNSSTRVKVENTGNVGIGTTSPSQKLEVSTDAERVSKFVGNTNDGTGFIGAVVEIETNNDTRGRGIYLTHRDSSDTSNSEWYMGTPYNGGGLSIGNAAYGTSINSATGPAHKDQSKLFITEAGNIGIGTTSPSTKLEIKGDATGDDTAQLIIASGGVDNNSIIHFTDDAGSQVNAIGALEGQILTLAAQNELVFKTGTSSILGNTNTRMTIDTNGKVGIGTISPASKLQVNGGVQIADDTDAASADKVGTLKYRVSGNNSYVDMCMQTGATSYAWVNIVQNNW